MATIKLFTLGAITLFLMQACGERSKTTAAQAGTNTMNNDKGCLQSFELNGRDTINRVYEHGVKHGRWITFDMSPASKNSKEMVRTKTEEGYYNLNKKEGFWKYYDKDGTLRNYIEYRNGASLKANRKAALYLPLDNNC